MLFCEKKMLILRRVILARVRGGRGEARVRNLSKDAKKHTLLHFVPDRRDGLGAELHDALQREPDHHRLLRGALGPRRHGGLPQQL